MKPVLFCLFILTYTSMSHSKDYYKKNAIDKAHQEFSKSILNFSNQIDEFFADTKHELNKTKNKSKLQVSFDTYFREGRGPYIIPDINYRLILPKTQRKLQLFIEDDDADNESETKRAQTDLRNQRNQDEDNDLNAGLRYMVKKSGIDFSTDTGIIVNIPIVAFAKFTAKKNIPLDDWLLKVSEQVKWVNNDGFTSDLDLDFDKKLSRKFLLRMVNNVFWNDEDYSIRFENGPSLFQRIDKKSGLSYHAHVITINTPDFQVENYILQATYRRLLYDKWLFMEASPFLNFPRTNNFHRTPGFVLGFEAIFGHI
jgi:hypothetical protein